LPVEIGKKGEGLLFRLSNHRILDNWRRLIDYEYNRNLQL